MRGDNRDQYYWPMCTVPSCDGPTGTRGFCDKHYKRWWRYGDVNYVRHRQRWELEDCWTEGPRDECWIWRGGQSLGYGIYRKAKAHRVIYELLREPIPDGMVLDHLCRVKLCVNPWHLEIVSDAINLQRGLLSYTLRTMCRKSLHDISKPEAWYVNMYGARTCLACKRNNDRRGDARRGRGYAQGG